MAIRNKARLTSLSAAFCACCSGAIVDLGSSAKHCIAVVQSADNKRRCERLYDRSNKASNLLRTTKADTGAFISCQSIAERDAEVMYKSTGLMRALSTPSDSCNLPETD